MRGNPGDEHLRRLERAAAAGDQEAERALWYARARAGLLPPLPVYAAERYVSPRQTILSRNEERVRTVAISLGRDFSGDAAFWRVQQGHIRSAANAIYGLLIQLSARTDRSRSLPWVLESDVGWQSFRSAIFVPVPGHMKGPPRGGVAGLAQELDWLVHGQGPSHHVSALSRSREVPSSRERRRAGMRGLSPEEHASSMTQVAPLPPGTKVWLVDNVVTSGATLEGARRVLGPQVVGALVYARADDVVLPSYEIPPYAPRECVSCGEPLTEALDRGLETGIWESECRRCRTGGERNPPPPLWARFRVPDVLDNPRRAKARLVDPESLPDDMQVLLAQFLEELGYGESQVNKAFKTPIPVRPCLVKDLIGAVQAELKRFGGWWDDRDEAYVERMKQGFAEEGGMPPVVLDEKGLADGFHRIFAANELGLPAVDCMVMRDWIKRARLGRPRPDVWPLLSAPLAESFDQALWRMSQENPPPEWVRIGVPKIEDNHMVIRAYDARLPKSPHKGALGRWIGEIEVDLSPEEVREPEIRGARAVRPSAGPGVPYAQVTLAEVDEKYHRKKIGTALYHAAARAVAAMGLHLSSDFVLSSYARSFWIKQRRKGRARTWTHGWSVEDQGYAPWASKEPVTRYVLDPADPETLENPR